jgi:uncharacterized protein (DUF433 family)
MWDRNPLDFVRRGGIEPPTRGFSVPLKSPETPDESAYFDAACSVFVRCRSTAVAQLKAVAEGREGEADELTVKLADAVLSLPIVLAALAVREGGRLAVARGVRLAEMVLRHPTRRQSVGGGLNTPEGSTLSNMAAEIVPGVTADSQIAFGKPVIAGTRVPVALVLGQLAGGVGFPGLCEEYDLTTEQVRAAVRYGAWLAEHETVRADAG